MNMTTGNAHLDEAIITIGKNVVTGVFKSLWSATKKAPDWVQAKYLQHDPFGLEAARYVESIERRYNAMRIVGMASPVPIRNIFVRVNILKKITAAHRLSADELEDIFNRNMWLARLCSRLRFGKDLRKLR